MPRRGRGDWLKHKTYEELLSDIATEGRTTRPPDSSLRPPAWRKCRIAFYPGISSQTTIALRRFANDICELWQGCLFRSFVSVRKRVL